MNRTERCEETYRRLFGQARTPQLADDPRLMEILQRFIFGDIFSIGTLSDAQREKITCVVLTAQQTLPQLRAHAQAALHVGVSPEELRAVVRLTAPFVGFPRALNAQAVLKEVFAAAGVSPEPEETAPDEDARFAQGAALQMPLYGHEIRQRFAELPQPFAEAVPRLLTEMCFGDFYTDPTLSVPEQELLIYALLAELGQPEQLAAHARGNRRAGNTQEALLAAVVQALPYIGFPKALNAMLAVQKIYTE